MEFHFQIKTVCTNLLRKLEFLWKNPRCNFSNKLSTVLGNFLWTFWYNSSLLPRSPKLMFDPWHKDGFFLQSKWSHSEKLQAGWKIPPLEWFLCLATGKRKQEAIGEAWTHCTLSILFHGNQFAKIKIIHLLCWMSLGNLHFHATFEL